MCEGNISFGVCVPEFSCQFIMMIPRQHRCEFAHQTGDCEDSDVMLPYGTFVVCYFNDTDGELYLGVILLCILVALYFLVLSCISDFFTPSLCYVSNVLGLSESVAGATLLAFGNAAPDLITSMVGAMKVGAEQIISQVLGAGMFLTSIVATVIALNQPFRVNPPLFFKNSVTYFVALILLGVTYADKVIYLYEALLFLMLYASYVASFFANDARFKTEVEKMIDQVLDAEKKEANFVLVHKSPSESKAPSLRTESAESRLSRRKPMIPEGPKKISRAIRCSKHRQRLSGEAAGTMSLLSQMGVDFPTRSVPRSRRTSMSGIESVLEVERLQTLRAYGHEKEADSMSLEGKTVVGVEVEGERVVHKHTNLFLDFLHNVNPIDTDDWEGESCCSKCCLVFLCPVVVVCKLFVPCIDETIVCNNWCKLLFILQCLYLPPFVVWSVGILELTPDISIPVFVSITLLGIVTSTFVAISSVVDEPPPYHMAVALLGFLVSIMSIYLIANEVVAILLVIGRLLSISMVTLSITVLPWGNSVGDLVNAISLSRAGFPTMAYTGIFGSLLLMILVGVGFSFLLMLSGKHGGWYFEMKNQYQGLIFDTYFFLGVGCVSTLLITPTFDYKIGRTYGTYLIILYIMFIIYSLLTEFDVVHPLGPAHGRTIFD